MKSKYLLLLMAVTILFTVSISPALASSHFSFSTDKEIYLAYTDDTVEIDGKVAKDSDDFDDYTFTIYNPEGKIVSYNTASVDTKGNFSTELYIGNSWYLYGKYVVNGCYYDNCKETTITYLKLELNDNQIRQLENKISIWENRVDNIDKKIDVVKEKLDAATKENAIDRLSLKMGNLMALKAVLETLIDTLTDQLNLYEYKY